MKGNEILLVDSDPISVNDIINELLKGSKHYQFYDLEDHLNSTASNSVDYWNKTISQLII